MAKKLSEIKENINTTLPEDDEIQDLTDSPFNNLLTDWDVKHASDGFTDLAKRLVAVKFERKKKDKLLTLNFVLTVDDPFGSKVSEFFNTAKSEGTRRLVIRAANADKIFGQEDSCLFLDWKDIKDFQLFLGGFGTPYSCFSVRLSGVKIQ